MGIRDKLRGKFTHKAPKNERQNEIADAISTDERIIGSERVMGEIPVLTKILAQMQYAYMQSDRAGKERGDEQAIYDHQLADAKAKDQKLAPAVTDKHQANMDRLLNDYNTHTNKWKESIPKLDAQKKSLRTLVVKIIGENGERKNKAFMDALAGPAIKAATPEDRIFDPAEAARRGVDGEPKTAVGKLVEQAIEEAGNIAKSRLAAEAAQSQHNTSRPAKKVTRLPPVEGQPLARPQSPMGR